MKGISKARCDAAIDALMAAGNSLMNMTVNEALSHPAYGKGDTLRLDSSPEIAIAKELAHFDPRSIFITEELGTQKQNNIFLYRDPANQPVLFICDPTDRSNVLEQFLAEYQDKREGDKDIGSILARDDAIERWERIGSGPAPITGAMSAITCLTNGIVSFSALFNYITREIFLACSGGIYRLSLADKIIQPGAINTDTVINNGTPLTFPPIMSLTADWKTRKQFITFVGKKGYQENFDASMIFMDAENTCLYYNNPGGPSRVLYLSSVQPASEPIGFIVANGEKISEWVHWLAFVRFAVAKGERSLVIYEIAHDRPLIKDGVLMTTPPSYSIFQPDNSGKDGLLIDASVLRRFPNACRFRSTILIAASDNEWANDIMQQHQYRQITLPPIEYL